MTDPHLETIHRAPGRASSRAPFATITAITAITTGLVMSLTTLGSAQQFTVAAGFVRIPGRVGAAASDHGPGSRLGLYLGARRLVSVGVELGFDRFNTDVRESGPQSCLLPGGATGDCFFRSRNRDDGFSASLVARIQARPEGVAPYAVFGLGVLGTRTRSREEVTDGDGRHLPNFEFDGTLSETSAMGFLGAGMAARVPGTALAITVEGRLTPVLHNYSGAPAIASGLSLLAGIRVPVRQAGR